MGRKHEGVQRGIREGGNEEKGKSRESRETVEQPTMAPSNKPITEEDLVQEEDT